MIDEADLVRLLSRTAKALPKEARRDFRAFLDGQRTDRPKRRKVHSWKKKPLKVARAQKKKAARLARPSPQLDLF